MFKVILSILFTIKDTLKTGLLTVAIEMNGVRKNITMKYNFSDGIFSAVGSIDVLVFSANKVLSAINEACYDLHKGKTWSDVTLLCKAVEEQLKI